MCQLITASHCRLYNCQKYVFCMLNQPPTCAIALSPTSIDSYTRFITVSRTCIGFSARQRKLELERLNEQLRKINLNLRQQARAGTVYAPGLMYAPTPTPMSGISIGSEDDGGNQGGAATLVGPRPEAPEDSQVGSYSPDLSFDLFGSGCCSASPLFCLLLSTCIYYWIHAVVVKVTDLAKI